MCCGQASLEPKSNPVAKKEEPATPKPVNNPVTNVAPPIPTLIKAQLIRNAQLARIKARKK